MNTYQIVAVKLSTAVVNQPMITGIVVDRSTGNIYEVTQLSIAPHAYQIVKNRYITYGAWYPEGNGKIVPNIPLTNIFEWVAERCAI